MKKNENEDLMWNAEQRLSDKCRLGSMCGIRQRVVKREKSES